MLGNSVTETQRTLADVLEVNEERFDLFHLDPNNLYYEERNLGYFFGNDTLDDDFTGQLRPAGDVSVDAVKATIAFNMVVFLLLMASYEVLRRIFPSVYAARRERVRYTGGEDALSAGASVRSEDSTEEVPENPVMPLTWIGPVFGVSWHTVRKIAGLDGYFFLRYIRMCLRITAVSTFWSLVILVPVFGTGNNGVGSWYHYSISNVETGSWRMWVPCIFLYLFTGFSCFVIKQELRHFIELRMDFLGRGDPKVDPQQHYSLAVYNIPVELRSDRALFDYFDRLFPGKIHSASVVLNLPDLESVESRRMRIVRRLEKSIAYVHATGERPTHVVGRKRAACCGIDMSPCDCNWNQDVFPVTIEGPPPEKGTRVDSIDYYTRELAESNKEVFAMQKRKVQVAESGNASARAFDWLVRIADFASEAATAIMEDSVMDNALVSPRDSTDSTREATEQIPQAEKMTSMYGAIAPTSVTGHHLVTDPSQKRSSLGIIPDLSTSRSESWPATTVDSDDKRHPLMSEESLDGLTAEEYEYERRFVAPGGGKKELRFIRRVAGRLGLDFFVAGLKYLNRQMDVAIESVVGSTMSSIGFVTFLDLASITSAACVPLTNKPNVLVTSVAPEPRDIRWPNLHVDMRVSHQRERTTNILLTFGVLLWSFPLAAIQAFATAEQLARIPGMQWILTINGGQLSAFINGYLPVLALLGLIMILPVIFERIAVLYECRKTYSDVQRSMLTRYFYYQLANIYVTVTAGSLWNSLADIIERPSNMLELLGKSLPTVVGYFVSLLVTKILAGLPTVFLRVGALSRMVFLRLCFPNKEKLTQRELDEVYRPDNVQYGWEFPTQLLVIVICFTYACICPVILPFGALFFGFAMLVYKKQLLYVYTPVYESGGALFPDVCQRTLYGLVCGQLTFIGYTIIRGCRLQPLLLIPVPIFTIWVMGYFKQHYATPSKQLSMERARECDRVSDVKAARRRETPGKIKGSGIAERRGQFSKSAYRQPVLTVHAVEPMNYRAGQPDPLTEATKTRLRGVNRYLYMSDSSLRGEDLHQNVV